MTTVTESPDFADPVAAAFWCADRGMPLFPLRGKVPLWPGWQERATTNALDFTVWAMDPTLNLGIACGRAGLLVVDEDVPGAFAEFAASKGEAIPPTFTVRTARGAHYYFGDGGHGLGLGTGSLPAGIDIRGAGGYVVAPGSVHKTGSRYLPVDPEVPVAPVPGWLVEVLTSTRPKTSEHPWVDGQRPSGLAGLPEVIPVGQRRDATFRYVAYLRAKGTDWAEAWHLLGQVWRRCEQPPGEPFPWAEAEAQLRDVWTRYDAPSPQDDSHAARVEVEAERLRIRNAARELVEAERAALVQMPPLDIGTLGDVLARPEEPPYRAERLVPSDASLLLVGKRKSGKTTAVANYVDKLILGGLFLERFRVRPISGRAAILNYEVSAATLARWLDALGVSRDRVVLVNLRGRANPLALPEQRAKLAARLRDLDVEAVVVDTFARAFTGRSQNDAGEVHYFLADLDVFARSEVGATDLVMTAHAGWEGERTRGSTALEDWPDSVITLTTDEEGSRFLHAFGRDVEVEEDRLHFDPVTKRLSLTGSGSRSETKHNRQLEEALGRVLAYIEERPGCTQTVLEAAVEGRAQVVREAARLGTDRGLIEVRQEGQCRLHYLAQKQPRPTPSHPVPDGAASPRPTVPIGDGDGDAGGSDGAVESANRDGVACRFCGTTEEVLVVNGTTRCRAHFHTKEEQK